MTASVVVLGGTGFIGSHLVERLAERGGGEIAVVSRNGHWPWDERPPEGTHLVSLDVTRPDAQRALDELLAAATTVVNLTGILARPSLPRGLYTRLHVDGTHRVVEALAAAKTPRTRLIHVSTTGVLGPTGDAPKDEEASPAPGNDYERTKLEGETIALASRRPSREVVIVRPGLVYGPRDLHLLPWFRAIAGGTYRPIGGGTAIWQPVYVGDVVRGIEAALDVPAADGQTFHVAGAERLPIASLGDRIAKALGAPPRRGSIPLPLANAAALVLEAAYALFGADPPLSRARVRTMTQSRVYAIERAERLLGFTPETSLDEGLATTVAWYRARKLLA